MNFKYAQRVSDLKASEIRELLKLTTRPEIISFAGGLPAPELFPIEGLKEITSKVFDEKGKVALQYTTTEGLIELRDIIAKQRMPKLNVHADADNILITSGSQQAIDFSAKLFIDKGDVVICETPSYLGALNAFKAYQPVFVEVPTDENGMIADELEKALKAHPNAKIIYTIPDFQNPSGKSISIERRKKIATLISQYQIPLIEDSPYSELTFRNEVYPSIKSFDKEGLVISLGTFSKTFCPGLRIGWICAEKELIEKYVMIKQGADLQCSTFSQLQAIYFMEKFDLDEHINKIINVYKNRRDIMLDSMEKYFPEGVTFTKPEGGLFTWVTVREDLLSANLLEEALKENVAFVPGGSFFANGGRDNHFRMNFSTMTEDKIIVGVKRLGEVLRRHY